MGRPSSRTAGRFRRHHRHRGHLVTRDYFRRSDELDLLDNLWASTIALYVFFITAGSWYILHDTGLAPEPDFAATALFTFAVLIIAYAARKLGWR